MVRMPTLGVLLLTMMLHTPVLLSYSCNTVAASVGMSGSYRHRSMPFHSCSVSLPSRASLGGPPVPVCPSSVCRVQTIKLRDVGCEGDCVASKSVRVTAS